MATISDYLYVDLKVDFYDLKVNGPKVIFLKIINELPETDIKKPLKKLMKNFILPISQYLSFNI